MEENNNTVELYCIELIDAFISARNQILDLIMFDISQLYSAIFDRR